VESGHIGGGFPIGLDRVSAFTESGRSDRSKLEKSKGS